MKFVSGAKLHRFKFNVPFYKLNDQTLVHTGRFRGWENPPGETYRLERPLGSPLQARFNWGNGHVFDSVKAQEENAWDDEMRLIVENALLNPANGYLRKVDGRGIWPEGQEVAPEPKEQVEQTEMPEVTPCIVLLDDNTRCPNNAVPGNFKCEEHLDVSELAPDFA